MTKRSFCILLCLFALALVFAASANEAGYMTFEQYDVYKTAAPLAEVPMTYEAWIRLPEGGSSASGIIIGNSNAYYFHGFWIQINKKGAPVLKFYNKVPDGPNCAVYTFTFSNAKVAENAWTHLAITTDVSTQTASCYINGVLAETQSFTYVPPLSPMPLVLGGDNLAGNYTYFRGQLREATLYSDVRSAAEVAADMAGVNTADGNLIAHYDLRNATFGDDRIADATGQNDMIRMEFWKDSIEPVTDFAYSFAVIGDQQKVTSLHPTYTHYMYDWILQNKDTKNIQYVLALGDVTDLRTDNAWEWEGAKAQFERLSGVIPMAIAKGNHDYPDPFDQYMSFEGNTADIVGRYAADSVLNVYKTARIGKTDYLFLVLEYGPTDAVIDWACGVVEAHPDHKVIINTHSYLHSDGTLTDAGDYFAPTGSRNDGVNLWNKLVRKYENIILVLCGHIESYDQLVVKSVGDHGNVVTQMLINPQSLDMLTPAGIVTMFYFNEDGNVLTTEFYSTIRKQYYWPEVFRQTIYVGERSGDCNGDGRIDTADVLLALSSIHGGESCKNADIDGDGRITLKDALGLMRAAVKGE
ncbi:MAG: metallophosphoesterase [Clostridia bacterium]|nr:metallophosphoesterase [Clostridia bacterium]